MSVALDNEYDSRLNLFDASVTLLSKSPTRLGLGTLGTSDRVCLVGCVASTSAYELYHHSTSCQVRGRSSRPARIFPRFPFPSK